VLGGSAAIAVPDPGASEPPPALSPSAGFVRVRSPGHWTLVCSLGRRCTRNGPEAHRNGKRGIAQGPHQGPFRSFVLGTHQTIGKEIGTDFRSVATSWVEDKKYKVLNVCSATLGNMEIEKRVLLLGSHLVRCTGTAKKNCKNDKGLAVAEQIGACCYPGGLGARIRVKEL
jgi:hypothetical protein